MMADDAMEPAGARTLVDVLRGLEERGFAGQLRALAGGRVECESCHESFDAGELEVAAIERLEGASDPADMILVAGATCPRCGSQGTLVLTYGPMAPPEDASVEERLRTP